MLKLIAVISLACCIMGAKGQNMLYVKDKSGTKISFPLKDIAKLTFNSGNLNVNIKDGTTGIFALDNIQNLNFYIFTDIANLTNLESGMSLYPNPVKDIVCIQYNIPTTEKIKLQIIDILGKIVYQQNLSNQPGTNNVTLTVTKFKQGLYLCRIQAGMKTIQSKFLKN